ncbi:hypothetical protein [Comamonas sp. NoAH]|nr:hypothetical protein [Comamonas sp. NoAH]
MKEFKIFQHPSGEIQAVKQGICWPAFLFTFFGPWLQKCGFWALD